MKEFKRLAILFVILLWNHLEDVVARVQRDRIVNGEEAGEGEYPWYGKSLL